MSKSEISVLTASSRYSKAAALDLSWSRAHFCRLPKTTTTTTTTKKKQNKKTKKQNKAKTRYPKSLY